MSFLSVGDLSIQAGDFRVDGVNLEVESGEYFVLMGATGSGKSLLLKAISGLLRVECGSVFIDKVDVSKEEPRRRKVGYVPQGSLLFPHMDVRENITFSVRNAGLPSSEVREITEPVIDALGVSHLLTRRPGTLSGGERQKVALARALASRPRLLILDEPVSAVDEPTRRELCTLLKKVQRQFRLTTIHVCHSLEEARLVGDRVGIMSKGRMVQVGELDVIAQNPCNDDVIRILHL